ncbi:hypothetical protein QFZ73_005636 [Peribacillus sp. V2I11]|nr:hypothetical protein [Peribacillus sp. V2I11]
MILTSFDGHGVTPLVGTLNVNNEKHRPFERCFMLRLYKETFEVNSSLCIKSSLQVTG